MPSEGWGRRRNTSHVRLLASGARTIILSILVVHKSMQNFLLPHDSDKNIDSASASTEDLSYNALLGLVATL
jgi:hypothetical protein